MEDNMVGEKVDAKEEMKWEGTTTLIDLGKKIAIIIGKIMEEIIMEIIDIMIDIMIEEIEVEVKAEIKVVVEVEIEVGVEAIIKLRYMLFFYKINFNNIIIIIIFLYNKNKIDVYSLFLII